MDLDQASITLLHEDSGLIEPSVLLREYRFRLRDISSVEISVQIFLDIARTRDPYRYELSHHMHAPGQAEPYQPSGPWAATEAEALSSAIKALTMFLGHAVRAGHKPDASWLAPSDGSLG